MPSKIILPEQKNGNEKKKYQLPVSAKEKGSLQPIGRKKKDGITEGSLGEQQLNENQGLPFKAGHSTDKKVASYRNGKPRRNVDNPP